MTARSGGSNAAEAAWSRQRKICSAPLAAASAFVTKSVRFPFNRGSNELGAVPACESEPSATGSIPGWASSRSSAWPVG
jgi:hypothetical protein